MNRSLITLISVILLLVSCGQQENKSKLQEVNQCIQNANAVIQLGNRLYYEKIENRLRDPITSHDAEVWEPRAIMVKKYVDSITLFIESLKRILLKQSDSLRRENAPIIAQLYKINGSGYVLLNKLMTFKESIKGIYNSKDLQYPITNIKENLDNTLDSIPLVPGFRDSLLENQRTVYKRNWVEARFAGNTSLLAMMQLNKIENEVLITERNLVSYFVSNLEGKVICGRPFPIAVINSSYVKLGQTIEVTAGIGQFSAADKPRIIIDGKEIKLNNEDVAQYSFKATDKPGKHKIPITIYFYRADGMQVEVRKNIEYIIAKK